MHSADTWRFDKDNFAGEWFDGEPLGNGDLGALVLPQHKRILFRLAKSDIWDERCDDGTGRRRSFYPFRRFSELRRLIDEQRWDEIDRRFEARLKKWRGKFCLLPAATLVLDTSRFEKEIELLDFRHGLDMRTATATASHATRVRRQAVESLVSVEHQVLAIRVRGDIDCRRGRPTRPMAFGIDVLLEIDVRDEAARVTAGAEPRGGLLWRRVRGYHDADYTIAVRAHGRGVRVDTSKDRLTISADRSTDLVLYVAIAHGEQAEAIRLVHAAADVGFARMRASHRRWWERFWRASSIDIPDADLLRQHHFGLYLLASSSRRGFRMPGLHGLWTNQKFGSGWNEYTNDMNTQMTYWAAYPSNHLELTWPQYDTICKWLPEAKRYTRDYWQCPGAQFSCCAGPDGIIPPGYLPTMHWAGQSAFVVLNFWWHFLFSRDTEFLRDVAHPVLRESALFYLDFLTRKRGGRYEIWPSNTPELGEGSYEAWGRNPSFDIAVIRELLEAVIASCGVLGCDDDLAAQCHGRLAHMPAFPMRGGALLDMASKEFHYSHGHPGMLSAIYPCWSQLPRGTARRSLDRFVARGERFWGCNTPAWLACVAARVGRGEQARNFLRHFRQAFTAGQGGFALVYDYHRTGRGLSLGPAVFCMESNLGYSAALPEMMLQSHQGFLEVFPAAPKDWRDVSFENLRARGAFLVSADMRRGIVREILITSERGGRARLKNPWRWRGTIDLDTRAGGRYRLTVRGSRVIVRVDRHVVLRKVAGPERRAVRPESAVELDANF